MEFEEESGVYVWRAYWNFCKNRSNDLVNRYVSIKFSEIGKSLKHYSGQSEPKT